MRKTETQVSNLLKTIAAFFQISFLCLDDGQETPLHSGFDSALFWMEESVWKLTLCIYG